VCGNMPTQGGVTAQQVLLLVLALRHVRTFGIVSITCLRTGHKQLCACCCAASLQ
jgi:hypothetical protein